MVPCAEKVRFTGSGTEATQSNGGGWRIDSRDVGMRLCNSRRFHLGTQYLEEATDDALGAFAEHLEGVLDASDPQGMLF